MNEKTVKWEGDRLAHWMLAELEEMRRSILAMGLEGVTGHAIEKYDLVDDHNIEYDNNIVEGIVHGSTSHISVDTTIALMLQYGDFYLPEEARQFIKECFDNKELRPENLPDNEDLLEKGREILEAFMEVGYTYYSACALVGATFIECGWNVHVFNKLEFSGKGVNNSTIRTNGWANCGEGLFGITDWRQKVKLIKALGPTTPKISQDEQTYNKSQQAPGYGHLCDLDEEYWCEMARIYLEDTAKEHSDKLLREELADDTEHLESLAASYLWKAGAATAPEWEKALEVAERYQVTHTFQNNGVPAMNAFAQQLCVSMFMDQYLHGEETLTLEDLGIKFSIDLENGGFKTMVDNIRDSYRRDYAAADAMAKAITRPLEPGLFKKSYEHFDVKAACEWINTNSKQKSQHACAMWVRKAIEAGGIPTIGRPNRAWKYIDYLPTIGFRFVQKVHKSDANAFAFEPGDIAVYQKNGNSAVPGHICMWTGHEWCSDFKQKNMIVYGGTSEAYIFRFDDSTPENAVENA